MGAKRKLKMSYCDKELHVGDIVKVFLDCPTLKGDLSKEFREWINDYKNVGFPIVVINRIDETSEEDNFLYLLSNRDGSKISPEGFYKDELILAVNSEWDT
jgi:hypothetical protein